MTKKSEKYHLQFIKLLDDMKAVNKNQRRQNFVQLGTKGRVEKKGGGVSDGRFSTKKKEKKEKKKHGHKTHWILPNNQFKTNLFFFSFLGGGDPFQLGSWSEGWLKLQSSLEKPSDKCQRTHIIQNSFHDT